MRANCASSRIVFIVAGFTAGLLANGCGDFWQAPGATGSTSGGTTVTTTTLAPSTSTPTVGVSVDLTATVSPSAATGTVTFYDNSASIGTGTLTSGTALLSYAFPTTGAQSLTAAYGGSSTYASSTSDAVTVTVSAATPAARKQTAAAAAAPAGSASGVTTSAYRSAAIHATGPFRATGGSYSAQNAEAAVVEGSGSVTLNGTTLTGAAGDGRGILLYSQSADPNSASTTRFAMTGGSIAYNCPAAGSEAACSGGNPANGQNNPATVFSVANTTAELSLTDVTVTNDTATGAGSEGTLLTAAALKSGTWGAAGADGGNVSFTAKGTSLAGDVAVDRISTAQLSLLEDDAGAGSSLTGTINGANTAKTVNLTLDNGSTWTVTGTSHLNSLAGLDLKGTTVNNIDGGGHCVYYSGTVNGSGLTNGSGGTGSGKTAIYALSGGGFLAPAGTAGLHCD
jgi:hypothetical protein